VEGGDKRPSWDEIFMQVAEVVAQRSTCLRRKVGAVLVKDKHIIATGYNGAPAGLPHCTERGECLRRELNVPSGERHEICHAVHAEQNTIIQAAIHGRDTRGSEIYLTCAPCSICAKMLVNAGVRRVVYWGKYPDKLAMEIMEAGGVRVENYSLG
jgi:dCMP deaminase